MRRRFAILSFVPLALAALAVLGVRVLLGFQFPVPWPDETSFVAPAFALATTGSLFDPGLNPDRLVMWMPPGYMAALAILFRVFGYSFALARWFSAVCCLGCLVLAAGLAWRLTDGWRRVAACWLVGAAFVSPFMLADSNLARMDMLFALVVLAALAWLVAGRIYVAAALVAISGVVHFNAVFFVAPLLVMAGAWVWRRRLGWPSGLDLALMVASAAVVGLYGVLVLRHWDGFVADIRFQLAVKRVFGLDDPAHPAWPVVAAAGLAVVALLRREAWDGAAPAAMFGLAFLVMAHEGHEIWYDYGQPLGFALIAIALLVPPATRWRSRVALGAAAAAGGLAVVMGARITPTMAPLLPTIAMLHRGVVASAEIEKVRRFIGTLPPGPPGATVNFGFSGMELFFLPDLARVGARWTMLPHSVTQIWPLRPYDWRVRCDSSEVPDYLRHFDIDYPRPGHDSGCEIIRQPSPAGKPAAAR